MSDNMVKDEVDELVEHLTLEMLKPKEQAELRQLITQTPELYRDKIENQEFGFAGIRKANEGYKKANGTPASENDIQKVTDRVDKRMLTESPSLIEYKLSYIGGNLVPNRIAHKKYAKENAKKFKEEL